MKLGLKKGWKSIVPLRLRGKSATRFCIFPKVKSAGYGPGNTPVYLNVYDLTPMNGYVYWAGLGIFHSGVEGKLYTVSLSLAFIMYLKFGVYSLGMNCSLCFSPMLSSS